MRSLLRKSYFKLILISYLIFIVLFYVLNTYGSFTQVLKHECQCFSHEKVLIKKHNLFYYDLEFMNKVYRYNWNLPLFTCDLFRSIKRGPNQKIISYSLYGKDEFYYKLITNLTQRVSEVYPDYVMRIYHDDSIDKSIICQLECSNSHVEFCDINKIPLSLNDLNKVLNLDYIHAMMWRFLPIGDSFVDLFMSRDTDSVILQREVDAVQEWIDSEHKGHIMRDNREHGTEILGGMWGFKSSLDRYLSNHIYNLIIDRKLSVKYKPNGTDAKGYDQKFLSNHIYEKINLLSLVHDSYTCKTYANSRPYPSQRIGNCFIGSAGDCDTKAKFDQCPLECRPKDHLDWTSC
ncbi:unnamed protein product [Brachionus calyciflorus]|uniref:Uncharacterized protein n=1 Tax=Brachionus calyciflorus TaxID=104777 RepID=A0A813WPC0_9BILA|nr:unnamed protein product [Brachionus calyciflorus]